MIVLKSEKDLIKMREAGRILARVMNEVKEVIRVGMSTAEIDNLARDFIKQENSVPAFLGYRGYPAAICVSVNEEVVHGIPGKRKLLDGDIVSLDLGIKHEDFFSDIAVTVGLGQIDLRAKKLIQVTQDSLKEGIKAAKPGNHIGDLSSSIQRYIEKNSFSVVRQFVGHGIGRNLHEEPELPNFGRPGIGEILRPGMVIAIEPMVNIGTWECEILDDGWTAVTKDKKLSAHFEHTVAITEQGPEVLTKL